MSFYIYIEDSIKFYKFTLSKRNKVLSGVLSSLLFLLIQGNKEFDDL